MWYFTTVRSLDKAFDIPNFTPAHTLSLPSSISFSPPLRACYSQIFFRFFSFFQLVNYAVRQNLQFSFPLNCFSMQDTFNCLASPLPLSLFHLCLFFRGLWTFGCGVFAARNILCLFFLSFLKWNTFCYYFYYYYDSFSCCCCCCCCTEFHLRRGNVN